MTTEKMRVACLRLAASLHQADEIRVGALTNSRISVDDVIQEASKLMRWVETGIREERALVSMVKRS